MKFAYFGIPHLGGTHTVYQSLRTGLAGHGVEVFWLGVGPAAKAAADDPRWRKARDQGVVLAGASDDDRQQARALLEFLERGACDGVFVNVLSDRVTTNTMRFLTPAIKRVMIVHSISRGTYDAARAIRDHVHATVGISPRIRSDLVRSRGFPPARTYAVPNAVDVDAFQRVKRERRSRAPLRLLFLGRIVNSDKGVFWLPEILAHLSEDQARLTVAGDGPDLPELERRCRNLGRRVRFIGRLEPEQVPGVLAEHDLFLFTSRFEGFGMTLVEAMAAGCVPVASRIKGVTDFVVRHGEDGLLFPMGDVRAAAGAIASLAADRDRLERLSSAARQSAAGRFDLAAMARAYFGILTAVMAEPPAVRPALPPARWGYPSGLKPGPGSHLPEGLKNWLRLWRERLA